MVLASPTCDSDVCWSLRNTAYTIIYLIIILLKQKDMSICSITKHLSSDLYSSRTKRSSFPYRYINFSVPTFHFFPLFIVKDCHISFLRLCSSQVYTIYMSCSYIFLSLLLFLLIFKCIIWKKKSAVFPAMKWSARINSTSCNQNFLLCNVYLYHSPGHLSKLRFFFFLINFSATFSLQFVKLSSSNVISLNVCPPFIYHNLYIVWHAE